MADTKKPRRRIVGEKKRMNLVVEKDLADWVFDYADRGNTSVTQLITDYFMELKRREAGMLARDAEQI